MNPLPLFLIIVTLPLLLGGCGDGKKKAVAETVANTRPKLEGVNYKKLEYRHRGGGRIAYLKGSDTPYTGKIYSMYENYHDGAQQRNYKDGKLDGLWVFWYKNGQKEMEQNYKDGKKDGLWVWWYENGQKEMEGNYKDSKQDRLWVYWHKNGQKREAINFKDGKEISAKYWNSKGEEVSTLREARK